MALGARCRAPAGALSEHHARPHFKPFVSWPAARGQHRPAPSFIDTLKATSGTSARSKVAVTRWSSLLRTRAAMADTETTAPAQAAAPALICTSVTATTMNTFLAEIKEAEASGVDVVELRLDYIQDLNPEHDLDTLMAACTLPYIVTYRPKWEGGNYEGPEPQRLAALKYAALKGAPYVDIELKAAHLFFAGKGEVPLDTKVIVSWHNFQETPSQTVWFGPRSDPQEELNDIVARMWQAGADIAKVATFANDIADCGRVLQLLRERSGPTIALAMGERGQIVRLLASKYGGYLTFAAMSPERASAPGQPTVHQMRGLFRAVQQRPDTRLYGIIGNPVSHSKSPLIHNTAFQHIGYDGVYVPLLVDDLARFLDAFGRRDFHGFSVTIPHKEAALALADSADPLPSSIGACNTLVRQQDGSFRGFNTDCSAAITAIERALAGAAGGSGASSPLAGKTFVVVGAGGAGRALAFGAAAKGAKVLVANRNRQRAEQLVTALPPGSASVADWEELQAGKVRGDVLGNSTSLGMAPNTEETPVPAAALQGYQLVFDAVYTPLWTRLLRDARDAGCTVVDGLQMFVGQAVDQFELFTQQAAPVEVMRDVVLTASSPASSK